MKSQKQVQQPGNPEKTFLEGPAGTGKTTLAVERARALLARGVPGSQILVVLPQRTLATPYESALRDPALAPGGVVTITTFGALARRAVELFWPLAAAEAGFARPKEPPTFLDLESAQYHMARALAPLLSEGLFQSLTLDRNRLYSQVLDNLNKAAFVRFPHTEIGERLAAAWIGEEAQRRIYADTQTCASAFRVYCLAHNLLDFSLWMEVFLTHLWPTPLCRDYLTGQYRHLILDNIEEDTPAAHDIAAEWLQACDSALVVSDWDAGYRRFLGADPEGACRLKDFCTHHAEQTASLVTSPAIEAFTARLARALHRPADPGPLDIDQVLQMGDFQFYPQMLDWVAALIIERVTEGDIPPGEIVVLAPYLSDALRFSLANRLEAAGIPVQSHRPSRPLRDEPATQCLLTLAALAHPAWGIIPRPFDVAYALRQAIDELDVIRAQLLTEILFRVQKGVPVLAPFEQVKPDVQARITYQLGERFDHLRRWLEAAAPAEPQPLDHTLSRLFGEVLSQPGFRFHRDLDSGKVAANLIDSVRNFRWTVGPILEADGVDVGREYLRMVEEGLIASQYVRSWEVQAADAVLLAPAYTFLMSNRPVTCQFWLNASSPGWWERLYQPLTHPYVLSRSWEPGRIWTDKDEVETNQETLFRLVTGLLRRCRQKVYLGFSDLDEHGFDQRGALLKVINRALRG